jgi:DNA polymerase III psi subunit
MTSEQHQAKLTAYQRAMLTHMGIRCWQSRVDTPPTPTAELMPKNVQTIEHKQANLNKLKQQISAQKPIDLHQHVLLCMEEQFSRSQLVKDVLLFLNLESDKVTSTTKPISQYKNYRFAWSVADHFNYQNDVLTTPSFNELHSTKAKKRLWELLTHHSNSL